MKIMLNIMLKIILFFAILIIPVSLLITTYSLTKNNIPLWNIGIKNIVGYARRFYIPTISISYLISILIAISLVDKIKVRSIFMLHIPPVLIGCLLFGVVVYTESRNTPFKILERNITTGFYTFFKRDVFNATESKLIFVKKTGNYRYSLYIYDKEKNDLELIKGIYTSKGHRDSISFNTRKRQALIRYLKNGHRKEVVIPFETFEKGQNITTNKFSLFYSNQIKELLYHIQNKYKSLKRVDSYILLASVIISILLISVPLSYLFNDGGWALSGIIGVVFILTLLPLSYNGIFKLLENLNINATFLGGYKYLLPFIIMGVFGIAFDIIAKVTR